MSRPIHIKFRLTVAAIVVTVGTLPVAAQSSVWELQPPDRFSVETTIDRETTVQIDSGKEYTSTTKEKVGISYRVLRRLTTGISIQVDVTSVVRVGSSGQPSQDKLADQRLRELENFSGVLLVAADGTVTNVPGRRESLRQLAGSDPLGMDVLSASCPEPVFISWFGHPFWMTAPAEKREAGSSWDRVDEISLGLMGRLRTIATCEIDEVIDGTAVVKISGSSRQVPNVDIGAAGTGELLRFQDLQATVDEFGGTGRMVLPLTQPTEKEKVGTAQTRRPWFESLTLEYKLSGQATIVSGGKESKLSFRQTRKEVSRLLEYRIGRPLIRQFETAPN